MEAARSVLKKAPSGFRGRPGILADRVIGPASPERERQRWKEIRMAGNSSGITERLIGPDPARLPWAARSRSRRFRVART